MNACRVLGLGVRREDAWYQPGGAGRGLGQVCPNALHIMHLLVQGSEDACDGMLRWTNLPMVSVPRLIVAIARD